MASIDLVARIDALLPQTQCTRCGYDGCLPYAAAIACGTADINRCPPGGPETIEALSQLTGRPVSELDPACGVPQLLGTAAIDEDACIGCTLCIHACPIDAILGAPKRLHHVLASLCSGCELCLPVCPVDCIAMIDANRSWTATDANAARERYAARKRRVARAERIAQRKPQEAVRTQPKTTHATSSEASKRASTVAAAFARARARRAAQPR